MIHNHYTEWAIILTFLYENQNKNNVANDGVAYF